jgi:DNA-binding MurR/RpiR family transcriptional regulator
MNMKSVIVRAKEYLKQASETEKGIIRFILSDPERASHMGTHELARVVFASPSTIGRLCRKIGFGDYREYQRALACELALREGVVIESNFEIGAQDSIETIISKTVSRSNASLEDTQSLIDGRVVEQCVGLMSRADSMTFFGVGASLLVAKDAFFKFIRVKKHCQISDDFDLQLVMAKTMTPNDVAVLISYSGKTKATVDCARQLKANGVPIIAITCFVESELSKLADYNLYVSATEYEFTSGKFTSRLSQLLVIDILYLAYIQATYSTSQTALIATHIDKRDKGEAEDGEAEFECIDDGDA